MAYDINLVARDSKYNSSYHSLIKKIKQYFPNFTNQYYDIKHWVEVFNGYTEQEIVQKGLGIHLEAEFFDGIPRKREIEKTASGFIIEIRHEDWIEISFWDDGMINLEMPNYPHREIDVCMRDILSIVRFLGQEGFALDHPTEDKVIVKAEVETFLYRSYLNRQMQVDRVHNVVHD